MTWFVGYLDHRVLALVLDRAGARPSRNGCEYAMPSRCLGRSPLLRSSSLQAVRREAARHPALHIAPLSNIAQASPVMLRGYARMSTMQRVTQKLLWGNRFGA